MAKSRQTREGRGRRYRERTHNLRDDVSVSIRRLIIRSTMLDYHIQLLQNEVDTILGRHGKKTIQRFALDSLRLTLLPPTNLSTITSRDRSLNSTKRIQRRVFEMAPSLEYPLENVAPTHGTVLRIDGRSYASLLFNEARVNKEQIAVHNAIGRPLDRGVYASLGISEISTIPEDLTQRLNARFLDLAPGMSFAFEAATFHITGYV
jgi:hypothetical protein